MFQVYRSNLIIMLAGFILLSNAGNALASRDLIPEVSCPPGISNWFGNDNWPPAKICYTVHNNDTVPGRKLKYGVLFIEARRFAGIYSESGEKYHLIDLQPFDNVAPGESRRIVFDLSNKLAPGRYRIRRTLCLYSDTSPLCDLEQKLGPADFYLLVTSLLSEPDYTSDFPNTQKWAGMLGLGVIMHPKTDYDADVVVINEFGLFLNQIFMVFCTAPSNLDTRLRVC